MGVTAGMGLRCEGLGLPREGGGASFSFFLPFSCQREDNKLPLSLSLSVNITLSYS